MFQNKHHDKTALVRVLGGGGKKTKNHLNVLIQHLSWMPFSAYHDLSRFGKAVISAIVVDIYYSWAENLVRNCAYGTFLLHHIFK